MEDQNNNADNNVNQPSIFRALHNALSGIYAQSAQLTAIADRVSQNSNTSYAGQQHERNVAGDMEDLGSVKEI
jgi:hypothetical protein